MSQSLLFISNIPSGIVWFQAPPKHHFSIIDPDSFLIYASSTTPFIPLIKQYKT